MIDIDDLIRETREAFARQCEVHGVGCETEHVAALNNALVGIVGELSELHERLARFRENAT